MTEIVEGADRGLLLLCDHASNRVPADIDLGIDRGQLTGGLTRIRHQHNRCLLFPEQPLWSEQVGKDLSLGLAIQGAEAVIEKHDLASCKDCAGESLEQAQSAPTLQQ